MVGRKTLVIALCMLVLLSITFTVAAASFAKQKEDKAGQKFEKIQSAQVNPAKLPAGVPPRKLSKISGKLIPAIPLDSSKLHRRVNISDICSTPGFACGGGPIPFRYGTGDFVNYQPHATEGLTLARARWWGYTQSFSNDYVAALHPDDSRRYSDYLTTVFERTGSSPRTYYVTYPAFGEFGGTDYFGNPDGSDLTSSLTQHYSPCLTSVLESPEYNMPFDTDPSFTYSDWLSNLALFTVDECGRLQADTYRSTCALGNSPALGSGNWLNPSDVNDNYILRTNAISRFGEFAWCNLNLDLDRPISTTVDASTGSVSVTWRTDLLAGNDRANSWVQFTPVLANGSTGTPVKFRGTATSHAMPTLTKDHSVTGTLSPGTYHVLAWSCTSSRVDAVDISDFYFDNCLNQSYGSQLQDSSGNEQLLVVPPISVGSTVTFVSPTPADGATQASGSATIAISSSAPLASATLTWTAAGGSPATYTMSGSGTSFTFTMSGLTPGTHSYHVTGRLPDSTTVTSASRTLIISSTAPVVTFTAPTPASGSTLASDSATISISTSAPVTSATVHLTRPDGSTTTYALTETTPTTCTGTISALRAGTNTYYVEATSATGGLGTSATRTFVVPSPAITFVSPTPASGSSQTTDAATIAISSTEALATAVLHWTTPAGTTTDYTMAASDSTHFSKTLASFTTGTYSYTVTATDLEGDSVTSTPRTLAITTVSPTSPVLTFTAPTPADTATLASDSQEIRVVSSETLSSGAVHLTRPDGTLGVYPLLPVGGTTYHVTLSGLRAGLNTYYVVGVDTSGETGTTSTRTFTVPLPVITFASPTPADGATLTSNSAFISISSTEALTSAVLHLAKPDGTTASYSLTPGASFTSFTTTVSSLAAGSYSYYVEGTDGEGDASTTATRTFTAPLPIVTFAAPTPADGATTTTGTPITITISSNEPLITAALTWIDPSGTITSYTMSSTSPTSFTYTLPSVPIGINTYRADVTDSEGDAATSATHTITGTAIAVTPPVVTFAAPTPATGATLGTNTATIAISSSEPLTSATLHLTKPDSTVTDYPMASTSTTAYRVSLSGLRTGMNTYYVTAVDADEGATGTSATRMFTAPLPTIIFMAPTPADGVSRPSGSLTVAISSTEPLASASLHWTNPDSSTTDYTMAATDSTHYTYTLASPVVGLNTYRVDVVNDAGDAATSATRTVTITTAAPTPPVITFISPTPSDAATLTSDNATIAISSDQPLSSATLSLGYSNGTTITLTMARTDSTHYTVTPTDLLNGTVTYSVTAIDTDGEAGTSATRTALVPITYLLHTFPGEGIASMAVFGSYLYVGTFNETPGFEGHSHVYRSLDGITWTQVYTADQSNWVDGVTVSVQGVYAMTPYNDGSGNALYIGTGGTATDGDVWRTFDGTTWTRVHHGSWLKINRLTVIDGTLFAGVSSLSGTGRVIWYNSTAPWDVMSDAYVEVAGHPVRGIAKYGDSIYYTSDSQIFRFGWGGTSGGLVSDLGVNGQALSGYSGKFYAGVQSTNTSLYKSTDVTTWTSEIIPNSVTIPNLRQLSDGYLYIPVIITDAASLWRRNSAEINERIVSFGLNLDTGTNYDRAVDVVEFHGRKYAGVVDRFGSSGTNRWGYVFKLTN